MAGAPIKVQLEFELSPEFIADVIDQAGYGIDYWATSAVFDDEAQTYTVTEMDDETTGSPGSTRILTYRIIAWAMQEIAAGKADLCRQIVSDIVTAIREGDAAEIDSEDADCIIQWAMFGDIVYG